MLGELVSFAIPPFIYVQYGFVPMAVSFAEIAGFTLFFTNIKHKEGPKALKAPPQNLKSSLAFFHSFRCLLLGSFH